ncbi:MAG: competence protein CoiA [Anaerolineales bacterium]
MPNLTCKYENEILVAYRDYDLDIRQLGREKKLQCRECGGFVHLRKGELGRIAHFAHFPNQQVLECSRTNESKEHLECKGYIAKLLESRYSADNVFPEHKVESGQEADVLLDLPNMKIAFEIQFSQQDQEKWKTRTELYKKYGVVSVWILGFRKGVQELQRDSNSDITITQTMQNAGVELPKSEDWQRYYNQSPYIRERQRNKTLIFHIITYEDKKIEFYIAYLRQEPDKKTLWHGDIFPIGSDWDFLEKDFRFVPKEEKSFNIRYIEERKQQEAIDAETKKQNDAYQAKLNLEQGSRWELKAKLLRWLKADHEAEIPELIMQYKEHKIERIFTIKIHPNQNEIPDRLIAEIAVYYKFIKTKPIGFEFSYSKDVEPFLREWKFCSDENKQFASAQISSGFLARLRKVGVLEKSPKKDKWKVVGKLIAE